MINLRLVFLATMLAHSAVLAEGYSGWKFGMSKQEVAAVGDPTRYYPFSNGDLGAQDEPFEGTVAPISFYFEGGQLNRVMLIPYQGTDSLKAKQGWQAAYSHIKRKCAEVEIAALGPGPTSLEAALVAFDAQATKLQRGQRHQMGCVPMPSNLRLWASLTKLPNDSLMVSVNYGEP